MGRRRPGQRARQRASLSGRGPPRTHTRTGLGSLACPHNSLPLVARSEHTVHRHDHPSPSGGTRPAHPPASVNTQCTVMTTPPPSGGTRPARPPASHAAPPPPPRPSADQTSQGAQTGPGLGAAAAAGTCVAGVRPPAAMACVTRRGARTARHGQQGAHAACVSVPAPAHVFVMRPRAALTFAPRAAAAAATAAARPAAAAHQARPRAARLRRRARHAQQLHDARAGHALHGRPVPHEVVADARQVRAGPAAARAGGSIGVSAQSTTTWPL